MRLGLYQGKSAGNSARDAYLRELNALLTPLIAARLGEQLASGAGGVDFQYEALKTYLMLGDAERLDPEQIRRTARMMAGARPATLVHPGRHVTWYGNDTQRSRAIAILNALLGSWGRKGGFFIPSG